VTGRHVRLTRRRVGTVVVSLAVGALKPVVDRRRVRRFILLGVGVSGARRG
jgi:hypothetical protein